MRTARGKAGKAVGNLAFLRGLHSKRAIFQPKLDKKMFSRNYYCSSDFMWPQTQDSFKGLGTVFLLLKRVSLIPSLWILEEAILRNSLKNSICLEMPWITENLKGRETYNSPKQWLSSVEQRYH